jgi:hypothetical protein
LSRLSGASTGSLPFAARVWLKRAYSCNHKRPQGQANAKLELAHGILRRHHLDVSWSCSDIGRTQCWPAVFPALTWTMDPRITYRCIRLSSEKHICSLASHISFAMPLLFFCFILSLPWPFPPCTNFWSSRRSFVYHLSHCFSLGFCSGKRPLQCDQATTAYEVLQHPATAD